MPSIDLDRSKRGLQPVARKRKLVQKYKPADVQRAFAQYFVGEESSGEQRMFCPLCEDPLTSRTPSASINAEQGDWNCLKTDEHGGSIADLVKQLKAETGFSFRGQATNVAAVSKEPVKLYADPLEDQDSPYDSNAELMSDKRKAQLEFLVAEKGLTTETISRRKIGYTAGYYTIPVSVSGAWRQSKSIRYLPNGEKDVRQTPGAVSTFYPIEHLPGNDLPVVIAEGEWDALLAHQESDRQFVVISGTGGAGTPPRDLSPLDGRDVFIAYDCDDPGTAGAEKLARVLRERGRCKVHILDLSKFGLPHTESHGEDLSDFFLKHHKTALVLLEEIERLREQPDEYDDIDRAMEAAFLELSAPRRSYFDSLLSEDDILARPPMSYIVEPFVPRGMASVAYGAPGSYKTFVAQDMGNHVRADMDWHGHPVAHGAVLLFEAEGIEQLQARIIAWREHYDSPDLAGFRILDEPLALSSPEGAAAAVRTVRGMEAAMGEKVELVLVDPAALYMSGSENEDGNRNLIIGLNAVAKYLNIGLLLIVHPNASGERARGTDHFRMLSGSYMRVEKLPDGRVGIVQEKVKNTARHAVILRPEPVGPSIVLASDERMSADEYDARKTNDGWQQKAHHKLSESAVTNSVKFTNAKQWIVDELTRRPGLSKSQILEALRGRDVGSATLNAARDALTDEGRIVTSNGPRNALVHHLVDADLVPPL